MKYLKYTALSILFLWSTAFAAPVSWDGNVGTNILQPLQAFWSSIVKGDHFVATSTSQASVFPYASTTVTSAVSLCLTGDLPCRSVWPTSTFGTTSISALYPLFWNTTTAVMSFLGLGTTTPWTQGQVAVVSNGNTLYSTPTTTASCSGSTSCTAFTILGSSPISISSTDTIGNWFTPQSWGNSTSTTLGFLQGFLSVGSSTIIGNATTTGTLFAGIASSSQLFGANLSSCTGTNALTWSAGLFTCTAQPQGTVTSVTGTYPIVSSGGSTPNITFAGLSTTSPWTQGQLAWVVNNNTVSSVATGTLTFTSPLSGGPFTVVGTGGSVTCPTCSSFAYPFVALTNFATTTAATTTPLWAQMGIYASSTSRIASTTFAINGNVGIGTTSPFRSLSIGSSGDLQLDGAFYLGTSGTTFGTGQGLSAEVVGSSITATPFWDWKNLASEDYDFRMQFGPTVNGFGIYASTSASSNQFVLNGNGGVGIATTTPWARFSVDTSSLTAGQPSFAVGSSSRSDLVITQAGRVGIGTSSPTGDLAVQGISGIGSAQLGTWTSNSYGTLYLNGQFGVQNDYNFVSSPSDKDLYINRPTGLDIHFRENNGADQMILESGGNLAIGATTAGAHRLQVQDSIAGDYVQEIYNTDTSATARGIRLRAGSAAGNPGTSNLYIVFANGNGTTKGSINGDGAGGVNFNTTSDRRLKENIATTSTGLSTLMKISVRDFDFKSDPNHRTFQGFIAQELSKIYPQAVSQNGDDGTGELSDTSIPWSIDYGRITPLIVQAVQDLNKKLTSLIARVTGVEAKVQALETQNAELESRIQTLEARLDNAGI